MSGQQNFAQMITTCHMTNAYEMQKEFVNRATDTQKPYNGHSITGQESLENIS